MITLALYRERDSVVRRDYETTQFLSCFECFDFLPDFLPWLLLGGGMPTPTPMPAVGAYCPAAALAAGELPT